MKASRQWFRPPTKPVFNGPSPEAMRYSSRRQCYWCGEAYVEGCRALGKSREHLVPRSLGGSNRSANIVYAHIKCNSDRGCNMNWVPFWEHRKVGQREVRI